LNVKNRDLVAGSSDVGTELFISDGNIIQTFHNYTRLSGYEETWSDGHPFRLLGKVDFDIGGDFQTLKVKIEDSPTYLKIRTGSNPGLERSYEGYIRANWYGEKHFNGFYQEAQPYSPGQLDAFGTTGIARALPTNPLSGMGQFIGELRDLPKVPFKDWKRKARKFKSLARGGSDEYLNAQFGWVPFVNDLRSFAKVAKNHTKLASQFARNSGRDIRRKSTVFKDSTNSVTGYQQWNGSPPLYSFWIDTPGVLSISTERVTEITFSGAFTYYLPQGDDLLSKLSRFESQANHLYGVRLNPDLLWKLAPWSWAADWVTNAGDIVRNWSAFAADGLVMRYGYVMAKQTITNTYSGSGLKTVTNWNLAATQRLITDIKQRRRATPYGFGLDPGSFSAKQWSIIAALGISRGTRP